MESCAEVRCSARGNQAVVIILNVFHDRGTVDIVQDAFLRAAGRIEGIVHFLPGIRGSGVGVLVVAASLSDILGAAGDEGSQGQNAFDTPHG